MIAATCALAAAVVMVTGCTAVPQASQTVATATATATAAASSSPAPSPSPSSAAPASSSSPALVLDGTAQENLALFRAVTERVWKGADRAHGRAYVDALTRAGFDKKAMQVTEDRSTVGNPAESLQFSVRWKDGNCLVGQVGPDTGTPVTVVVPGLADGGCLLGKTRTIDW